MLPHTSHMSDKKPFLKVEGEWNGVMYTKLPDGVSQAVYSESVFSGNLRNSVSSVWAIRRSFPSREC